MMVDRPWDSGKGLHDSIIADARWQLIVNFILDNDAGK